jgi:SAM-dependent methyltransferase
MRSAGVLDGVETRELLDYYFCCYTYKDRIAKTFGQSLPPAIAGEILDVGCSEGLTTAELAHLYPDSTVTGIDFDKHSLRIARREHAELIGEGRLEFMLADGYHLERHLPDRTFDAIFVMNNLYFRASELDETRLRRILDQAKQKLKPNGYLLLSGHGNYLILQETPKGTRLKKRSIKRDAHERDQRSIAALTKCA